MHLFLGGDFNFVEHDDDATIFTDYHEMKQGAQNAWLNIITKLLRKDIFQKYIPIGGSGEKGRTVSKESGERECEN